MIGRLSGILESVGGTQVLLDVGGVGYVVACSARTLGRLPGTGEAVRLLIDTHVREDAISLYGFLEASEQEWFRILTTVQGVGAKLALAILGALTAEQLAAALAAQDKAAFTRIAGVGPKLGARLLTELKDKGPASFAAPENLRAAMPAQSADKIAADALSALTNLGYRRAEAFDAVTRARKIMPEAGLDALIPAALHNLARQGEAA